MEAPRLHWAPLTNYPERRPKRTACGIPISEGVVISTLPTSTPEHHVYGWNARDLAAEPGVVASSRHACPNCRHLVETETIEIPPRRDGVPEQMWIGIEDAGAKTPYWAFDSEISAMMWATDDSRRVVGPIAIPRDRTPRRAEMRPTWVEDET